MFVVLCWRHSLYKRSIRQLENSYPIKERFYFLNMASKTLKTTAFNPKSRSIQQII